MNLLNPWKIRVRLHLLIGPNATEPLKDYYVPFLSYWANLWRLTQSSSNSWQLARWISCHNTRTFSSDISVLYHRKPSITKCYILKSHVGFLSSALRWLAFNPISVKGPWWRTISFMIFLGFKYLGELKSFKDCTLASLIWCNFNSFLFSVLDRLVKTRVREINAEGDEWCSFPTCPIEQINDTLKRVF